MQLAVPHRLFDRLVVILAVAALTIPITLLEVMHPGAQTLRGDFHTLAAWLPHTATQAASVSKPAAQPVAKPHTTPKTTATPKAATATPAVVANTATTNSFVHLRAAESTSSQIITDLNAGTTVQLRDDANATWQGVIYQGESGYIYRAYLQYQPAPVAP